MSTEIRNSPSGVEVDAGGGAVESVFGRDGDVVANGGDYASSQIDNASSLPGATVNDAMASVSGSDDRANESTVPGATVSDALDYLEANLPIPPSGRIFETFSGGVSGPITTATGNDDRLGDNRWNIHLVSQPEDWSIDRLPAESGSIGVYRIDGPETNVGGSTATVIIYLGSTNDALGGLGIARMDSVAEYTWRARFLPNPASTNTTLYVGMGTLGGDHLGGVRSTAFVVTEDEGANYQVYCRGPSGSAFIDTGIECDEEFHDFRAVRISDTEMQFFIDGVLVVTQSDPDFLPEPSTLLNPSAGSGLGETPTGISGNLDLDTFELVPV